MTRLEVCLEAAAYKSVAQYVFVNHVIGRVSLGINACKGTYFSVQWNVFPH